MCGNRYWQKSTPEIYTGAVGWLPNTLHTFWTQQTSQEITDQDLFSWSPHWSKQHMSVGVNNTCGDTWLLLDDCIIVSSGVDIVIPISIQSCMQKSFVFISFVATLTSCQHSSRLENVTFTFTFVAAFKNKSLRWTQAYDLLPCCKM